MKSNTFGRLLIYSYHHYILNSRAGPVAASRAGEGDGGSGGGGGGEGGQPYPWGAC